MKMLYCEQCKRVRPEGHNHGSKPKVQIGELAAKRSRCKEAKAAGLPCKEFNTMKWAYGLTSVEGRYNLMVRTLESLKLAGFPEPRLFVDGAEDEDLYLKTGLHCSFRQPRIRAYANWLLGLLELFCRDPNADRYCMFQDDFVTYRNLRAYLETVPYPERGYWNLYTWQSNEQFRPKDYVGFYPSNQFGRGAVALCFDSRTVATMLSNNEVARYLVDRPKDPNRGHKLIDGGVIDALKKANWTEYVHYPTLTQHTGEKSSIKATKKFVPSPSFRGEEFDALGLTSK